MKHAFTTTPKIKEIIQIMDGIVSKTLSSTEKIDTKTSLFYRSEQINYQTQKKLYGRFCKG